MSLPVVNFQEKLASFADHWAPRVVAALNDYEFKVVKLQGAFVWHDHPDTDEAFIVLEGRLVIETRDGETVLGPGEMCVVPRGVEHRPVAAQECHVLLIEPRGTVNTGSAGGDLTAPTGVWI